MYMSVSRVIEIFSTWWSHLQNVTPSLFVNIILIFFFPTGLQRSQLVDAIQMIDIIIDRCLVLLWVQNDFAKSLFLLGPNSFGHLQTTRISPEKYTPNQFGPDQNNLDGLQSFWVYKRTRHQRVSSGCWVRLTFRIF